VLTHRLARAEDVPVLGSTNGCYVNDRPIDTCLLRDADFIRIGNVIFKFQIADAVSRAQS